MHCFKKKISTTIDNRKYFLQHFIRFMYMCTVYYLYCHLNHLFCQILVAARQMHPIIKQKYLLHF